MYIFTHGFPWMFVFQSIRCWWTRLQDKLCWKKKFITFFDVKVYDSGLKFSSKSRLYSSAKFSNKSRLYWLRRSKIMQYDRLQTVYYPPPALIKLWHDKIKVKFRSFYLLLFSSCLIIIIKKLDTIYSVETTLILKTGWNEVNFTTLILKCVFITALLLYRLLRHTANRWEICCRWPENCGR